MPLPIVGWGRHQSAFAGACALAIIMLPFVARATMEVLALVPHELREGSYALGVSKWQTVLRVVLPTSLGGILTGTTLAVARAAGETAPLLFTCSLAGGIVDWNPSHSVQSIPLTIFQYSESPDESLHAQAWAASFVLIAFVLVTSVLRGSRSTGRGASSVADSPPRHRHVTARRPTWHRSRGTLETSIPG